MKKTLLFVSLIILAACTKEDNITISDGTYESNGTILVTPAILYTKDGSITDVKIISDYLQRKSLNGIFTLKSGNDTTSDNVSFVFKGTTVSRTDTRTQYDVVYKEAGFALIVEQDTAWASGINMTELNCQNVALKIRQNVAPRNCLYTAVGQYCGFKQQFPIVKNGSSLNLPVINFHFTQTSSCEYREPNALDFFNTDILSELQATDTLLVQTSTIPLYKK
ncbi:hypothetical protein SAMN05428988_0919 [Chitinophaga sp. YR573]|uniref:hypothetical protein n=1 Tax=Chitinophaga sp. YR573 TaxID=1881040 RepID=UPI0008C267E6|nr:hypothetical protein [Chitinophaga sp. YR573]SEV97467.1 hypothetical protein SAMN05428988_0919 [Chitinophaga sp. YR573]